MKVKELIELLKAEDPELMVLVNGYEDGYDNLKIRRKRVEITDGHEEYNGEYDDSASSEPINAIIISRY